jgi:hypothetical protein
MIEGGGQAGMRARWAFPTALLAVVLTTATAGAQEASPGAAAGTLCVLSIDEVSELVGLPLVTMASGPANCTYSADPDVTLATIDLRLEPPEPLLTDDDALAWIRTDWAAGGRDLTVAGFPAWEADEGLWVDVGDEVFVVQPILFFLDDPPAAQSFMVPVAELALPRLEGAGGT